MHHGNVKAVGQGSNAWSATDKWESLTLASMDRCRNPTEDVTLQVENVLPRDKHSFTSSGRACRPHVLHPTWKTFHYLPWNARWKKCVIELPPLSFRLLVKACMPSHLFDIEQR